MELLIDVLAWFRKAVAIDIWLVSTGLSKDADGLNKVWKASNTEEFWAGFCFRALMAEFPP